MKPISGSGSLLREWPLIVALGVLGVLLAAPTAVAPLLGSSVLLVLFLLLILLLLRLLFLRPPSCSLCPP